MAKLGEANVGGRLVPAWLLDTPAKYLDGGLPVIQANDDLDSYTTPGEYIQGNTSVIITLVNFPVNLPRGEMCLKVSSLGGPGYICQEIKAKHGFRFRRAIRFSNNGVFQPWEYEDPELMLGVEYRTTERYNGKPVYTMAVDCKSGPTAGNATATYIGIGETVAAENVISVDAFCGGGYTIPPGSHYPSIGLYATAKPSVGISPKNQITVYVATSEDVSSQHIYAVIKYTKTEQQ